MLSASLSRADAGVLAPSLSPQELRREVRDKGLQRVGQVEGLGFANVQERGLNDSALPRGLSADPAGQHMTWSAGRQTTHEPKKSLAHGTSGSYGCPGYWRWTHLPIARLLVTLLAEATDVLDNGDDDGCSQLFIWMRE